MFSTNSIPIFLLIDIIISLCILIKDTFYMLCYTVTGIFKHFVDRLPNIHSKD